MPSTSGKLSRARSLVLTVLLIGSALLGETALSAQQPSGTVTGTVADAETLQPVAGAVVGLAGTPHRVITGRGGQFRLDRVSPGSYTLEVRGLGFVDVTRTGLLVSVGETTDLGVIPLDLSPIVMERLQVTATKDLRSVGEVPALVSVVRREEMERGGKVELTQAIRNVPGLLNSALLQSFESVLLRGMPRTGNEFTTTLLLVDGVPQTDSRNSARVINLPINDVSAVEVVRGPNSALYGRTAIGGVVNVLTDEPTPSQTGHLELQAGEFGHLKGKGSISGPIDERFRYYLSGATGRGSGYFEQDFDYSIREHSGYAKLAVTPDARSDGMVSLNYVVSDNSVPTPIPVIDGRPLTEIDPSFRRYTNLNIPSANYHQEELRATLNYRRDLTDWLTFTEVFGYRRIQYKFEDDGDVIGAPFDLAAKTFTMYPFELQTDEDIIYQEARVQITPPLGVENGLLLGYSYEHNTGYGEGNLLYTDEETLGWPIRYDEPRIPPREEWQAFRFGGNDHRMGIHAVYAQYDIAPVDRLRLTAGARYDRADLRNRQTLAQGTPVIEDDFDAFSPKISGTLFLLRNRETPRLGAVNLNAYATYSEAFLPPRTPSGLRPRDADVKLQPEDVSNYEGGIKGDLLGGRLYFEAALFRMTRDGIVVQTREGPFFRPSNAGQQKFRGTEAGVTLSPVREVSVFANAAWYRHRFGEFVIQGPAGDRVLTGRRLPISPDRIYNAGVSWQSPWGIGAVLNVQRVGDRYLDQENTFLLDAYTLADAALSWRRGGVTLTLSAQNLFDAEYVTMGDISTAESIDPAPPRQLLLLGSYRLR